MAQCSDRLQLYQSSKICGMVFYNPVLDRNDIPLLMEKTDGKIGPDDEGFSLLKAAHILKDPQRHMQCSKENINTTP